MTIYKILINTLLSLLVIGVLILSMVGCSGTNQGGTETGTTEPIDVTTVAAKINNVASALVPDMESSGSSSISLKDISYKTSDDWSAYLETGTSTTLTDIFGPNEDDAPVTRIRVLVSQFKSQVESVFSNDAHVTCSGKSTLDEGDLIEIPFYGEISNGTSDNRYFDCISEWETESGTVIGTTKTLYGYDDNNVIHIVHMKDTTSPNTTDTDERGETTTNLSVTLAEFAEVEEEEENIGYLDLRYSQATIYCGPDGEFWTSDDVIFKSRSRVTGRAAVDNTTSTAGLGTGDFTVTKYDIGNNATGGGRWNYITKTIGRGSYTDEAYSIFNIDSTNTMLLDQAGIYCIQSVADSMPSYAESENCEPYEDTYAWTGSTFPFTLSPEIEESFESKEFFEGDDTDMISNDSDNFTIPTYDSTPTAVEEETPEEDTETSEEES